MAGVEVQLQLQEPAIQGTAVDTEKEYTGLFLTGRGNTGGSAG